MVACILFAGYIFAAALDHVVEAKHLKVVLKQSRQRGSASRFTLVAEVTLDPGMHVYAPGIEAPYRAIQLNIQPAKGVTLGKPVFPRSEKLHLAAIDETVPVYQGTFRIEQAVAINRTAAAQGIEVNGSLEYQTCDDKICYRPVSVPLSWTLSPAK